MLAYWCKLLGNSIIIGGVLTPIVAMPLGEINDAATQWSAMAVLLAALAAGTLLIINAFSCLDHLIDPADPLKEEHD
nr:MAG: hypothetical protein DIU57_14310 [Pseudomonadota bacterium]